jgi:hypothetical protein
MVRASAPLLATVTDVVFLERPDGEVAVVRVVLDEHDLLVSHEVSFALRVK